MREERDCNVARGKRESGVDDDGDDDARDDAEFEAKAATVAGDEIVT